MRDPSTSEYRPGSLTKLSCDLPVAALSFEMRVVIFSSSSNRLVAVGSISSALHTSAATNNGSPSAAILPSESVRKAPSGALYCRVGFPVVLTVRNDREAGSGANGSISCRKQIETIKNALRYEERILLIINDYLAIPQGQNQGLLVFASWEQSRVPCSLAR